MAVRHQGRRGLLPLDLHPARPDGATSSDSPPGRVGRLLGPHRSQVGPRGSHRPVQRTRPQRGGALVRGVSVAVPCALRRHLPTIRALGARGCAHPPRPGGSAARAWDLESTHTGSVQGCRDAVPGTGCGVRPRDACVVDSWFAVEGRGLAERMGLQPHSPGFKLRLLPLPVT